MASTAGLGRRLTAAAPTECWQLSEWAGGKRGLAGRAGWQLGIGAQRSPGKRAQAGGVGFHWGSLAAPGL